MSKELGSTPYCILIECFQKNENLEMLFVKIYRCKEPLVLVYITYQDRGGCTVAQNGSVREAGRGHLLSHRSSIRCVFLTYRQC